MFTKVLVVNKKTYYRRVGAAKSKSKANKYVNTPWALKKKRKGQSRISEKINNYLYKSIIHHLQVMQSPIANDCLKVKMDGYTEPKLVPNFLLQVSVRELHNNIVSATKYGGLKEAIYEDNNILISDSTLCSLLPPQFKNILSIYKVMCCCECFISAKCMHLSLLS